MFLELAKASNQNLGKTKPRVKKKLRLGKKIPKKFSEEKSGRKKGALLRAPPKRRNYDMLSVELVIDVPDKDSQEICQQECCGESHDAQAKCYDEI